MPNQVQWQIEDRVIHVHYYGNLVSDDLLNGTKQIVQFLDQGKAPVHLIAQFEHNGQLPIDLRKASDLATYLHHPNLGWTVQVGGNSLVNFLVSVASQVTKLRVTRRDSLEEALQFLVTQDSTLQTPAANQSD